MSVNASVRLSTQSGAAGDTTASTPGASIGKYMSTSELVDGALENLFANVTAEQAAAGYTAYRCVFVLNAAGSSSWRGVKVWLESQAAGGGDVTIGLDPAGVVAAGQVGAQAATPANGETAPSGVEFSAPYGEDRALNVGDMPGGTCAAVWFRLRVRAGAEASALDNVVWRVKGSEP